MKIEGRGSEYGVIHLRADQTEDVTEFAVRTTALTSSRFEELVDLGAVYLANERLALPIAGRSIQVGQALRIHGDPRRFAEVDLSSRIVFRNDDFLIVNKPSGLPVHALTDNRKENLLAFLEKQLGQRVFITHRLDVETSGLLLVSLRPDSQVTLNKKIAERSIRRMYTAFVCNKLAPGSYVHYMEPSPTAPKKLRDDFFSEGLRCELEVLSCMPDQSWICGQLGFKLEIQLMTGRTQQIRAQLAALGAPILGDLIYGGAAVSGATKTIALEASAIEVDGRRFSIFSRT